ncbi:hypothetical protein KBB96_09300 [Luteolibacter ambystomatis]|uniref:DUF4412 domain-containing protein n=1 Tax=Luteolibacter ambystomatis TaxID=2824561 RepID=A0A975J319_9BACT|nr:hypothetical protein [Luteolibacter ambystomatis]QUE53074.1 hypothetical protein KBB96_09300 [Luteolibacter ambystomatis]
MKIALIVPLAVYCSMPAVLAQGDRLELSKKLKDALGYVCLPQQISPDGKVYARGDMCFFDVAKKIANPDEAPLFGLAISRESGQPLAQWIVDERIHATLEGKLKSDLKKDVDEKDELELDEMKEKYATTDEEKAKFDEWVLEARRDMTGATRKDPLGGPGFHTAGWLDNNTAIFYREKDARTGMLVTVVDLKKKEVTLYDLAAVDSAPPAKPKFALQISRGDPGGKLTLVIQNQIPPEPVKKLVETMKVSLKEVYDAYLKDAAGKPPR